MPKLKMIGSSVCLFALLLVALGCGTTKHLSARQVILTKEIHSLEEEKKVFAKGGGEVITIIDSKLAEKQKELQKSQEKLPKKRVSAEEASIALARQKISLGVIRCIHAEQQSGDKEVIIGGRSEKESLEVDHAVRELIAAYRKSGYSKQMHTELAEEAENLQKFCWPWLAREIRTVLTYG